MQSKIDDAKQKDTTVTPNVLKIYRHWTTRTAAAHEN